MRTKSKVLRRINTLYLIFFAVIAVSLVVAFSGDDFQTAFSDAHYATHPQDDVKSSKIFYYLPAKTTQSGYEVPIGISSLDTTIDAYARIDRFDVVIKGDTQEKVGYSSMSLLVNTLMFLSGACYGLVFVFIFVILRSLRRSIKSDDIFDLRNILRTRAMGFVILSASLLRSFADYFDVRLVANILSDKGDILLGGSTTIINTSIQLSFNEIIMAVLVLVMAEVFRIGYDISQEQKLTI